MTPSGGLRRRDFSFADQMPDAAAIFSWRERRPCYLNAAAERILGIDSATVLESPVLLMDLIVEEDRPLAKAFLEQTEVEGRASGEFRIRRRDGQPRWLAVRSFPYGDDDVADRSLRGLIAEDITERKSIERVQTDNELRFRQLAESIDEVFWIVALDFTQVHYVSPAYAKVWGRSADELYVAPFKWVQSVHPDDQAALLAALSSPRSAGFQETQFRVIRGDETRHIRHRWAPARNADGVLTQLVCMSEDITEQKHLERQAEEAVRAQREALVREVHHRIKNNLQGVTGMLRNFANRHKEVAKALNEAIAQVQAVAVIYGLQGRPGAERVMLADLVEEIADGVGHMMHSALEFRGGDSGLRCMVVVSEMEAVPVALVLNEMVFNAIKHGATGLPPRIDMKIDIARERVTLIVSNTGILPACEKRGSASGGSGLPLIRSLLPRRGAHFDLVNGPAGVEARLTLQPPVVTIRC